MYEGTAYVCEEKSVYERENRLSLWVCGIEKIDSFCVCERIQSECLDAYMRDRRATTRRGLSRDRVCALYLIILAIQILSRYSDVKTNITMADLQRYGGKRRDVKLQQKLDLLDTKLADVGEKNETNLQDNEYNNTLKEI
ncbi:Hypothetical predicted protein, partial [Mytilus galloprovincialis]